MSSYRRPFRSLIVCSLGLLGLGSTLAPARAAEADAPAASVAQQGIGLRVGDVPWPRWQGRLGLSGAELARSGSIAPPALGEQARPSISLLGDYYFSQHVHESQDALAAGRVYGGGFRATGGLLLGNRASLWAVPDSLASLGRGLSVQRRLTTAWASTLGPDTSIESVPYVGVGYSGLAAVRGTGGGWGFSADVGVMALQPGSAVRLGQQALGETLRDIELSPMLQLGVSYSF